MKNCDGGTMKRSMSKWMAALVVAAASVIPTSTYAMNGMAPIGYGVKSQGMGGVGVALPQDSFAAAHNPAGMWMLCNRWDVGLSYVFQDVRARTTAGQNITSNRGLWFPEVGVNWNFCRCQSFGLAFYTQGALNTKYNEPLQLLSIGNNSQLWAYQWVIMPSWSWQINRVHSVGVAVNFVISALEVKGIDTILFVSQYPAFVENKGTQVATGGNIRVGWIGQFSRCFRVGATWQTKTWQRKFDHYQGFLADGGDFSWPYYLALGFSYQIMPCLTLAFDYGIYFWGGRKQFGHTLNGEGIIGAATFFGRENGPGFGWNDQSVVKVGLAWDLLSCLTLRLGYNHGVNPVNVTETWLNRLTGQTVANHLTVGATWKTCCGELSGFYWFGWRSTVHGRDSSPNTITVDLPVLPESSVSNQQNALGLSWGGHF
jgi:long-chain fatty acid transport protein